MPSHPGSSRSMTPRTLRCARRATPQIAEAAYYIAEQRGFEPDHELEDWVCAERESSGKLA